jgi:starch synthase
MNILLIASESMPYCKTGGLADVVYGLARELHAQHNDVRLVIPCYRGVLDRANMQEIISPLKGVPLGIYKRDATIWKTGNNIGPITYLVQNDFYFGRNDIYGYLDDYERFIFFTRAALEMLSNDIFREHEKDWFPTIIQGYDSIAGFIPSWLPTYTKKDSRFNTSRFILFIHNNSKLGLFGNRALRVAQLNDLGIYPQIGETPKRINFLGRGMLFADKLVTVNPHIEAGNPLPDTSQVLKPVFDTLLAEGRAIGIHNAIDYDEFNPADDLTIEKRFNDRSLRDRVQNKLVMQRELGFEQSSRIPLLGMVSRLMPQKGFELLSDLRNCLQRAENVQFVILAEPGDPDYMHQLQEWKQEWKEQRSDREPCMEVFYDFDDRLARRIYASCDIFLLPSKEESSNIQQFIAMRYGAVPLVHWTGFFRDTVHQYTPGIQFDNVKGGIGFTFEPFSGDALSATVGSALELYASDTKTWLEIQRHNMREDFSWFGPARKYMEIYQKAIVSGRIPPTLGISLPLDRDRDADLLQTLMEIDSLPGLIREASEDTLKQVARLVRDVAGADAVYVWVLSEDVPTPSATSARQQIEIVSDSFDNSDLRTPPDKQKITTLLSKGTIVLWPQFADIDMVGLCRPIAGLKNSKLAKQEKWISGYSVPVVAHSRALGRMDVLFTKEIDVEWVTSALTTLANSFGFRLETIRLRREADQILAIGNAFLQAQSYNQAINLVQDWAKKLSHADVVWIYENKDGLKSWEPSPQAEFGLEIARQAAKTKEVIYIPDWSTKPNSQNLQITYRSVMSVPILGSSDMLLGVLVVAKNTPAAFSRDDEQVLRKQLSTLAANAMETTRRQEERGRNWVEQLGSLSNSLTGSQELKDLVDRIVETIAQVVGAEASSLYLIDKATGQLVIQAAAGYQKPLVKKTAEYALGEGVTGTIAKLGNTVRANSIQELHDSPGWVGKQNPLQEKREPNSFLGLPLKVRERFTDKEEIIGVLKVEDIKPSENHPEAIFTDQDVLLVTMMANVIATVVYNTQVSGAQLQELGNSLGELSNALAGGREMRDLVDQVVETMARVLHAQASSLYLIDKANNKLVIQAAAGYQKPLVKKTAEYALGEGVTGTIAKLGNTVRANSIQELHDSPGWVGKQNPLQEKREPNSFLGLPLKVRERFTDKEEIIGVLKVEDIKPSENHPEAIFTDQDVLLVTMMANVIATVISNTRWGEARVGEILQKMGMLAAPVEAAPELLADFARSADMGILDQLAMAIARVLDNKPNQAETEAQALFEARANPALYGRIASWATHSHVHWEFSLLRDVLSSKSKFETWEQVSAATKPWQQIEQAHDVIDFSVAVQDLVSTIANQMQLTIAASGQDTNSIWHGIVLDTENIFGYNINRLPFFFQQQGNLDEDNVDRLRKFAQEGLHQHYSVLVLISWALNLPRKQALEAQDALRKDFVDLVILDVADILNILQSPDPAEVFRRLVLRQVRVTPPYVIRGAVPAKMFFGREAELRRLIENAGTADFAIVGNRRIGKTSLLHFARTRLEAAGRVQPLLIDCQTVKAVTDFFTAFQMQQNRVALSEPTPAGFVEMATQCRKSGKPLVLLMDEVDDLLHYEKDHGETLVAVWRQLAQAGICHFIFCGSRRLAQDVENPHHLTLYNFPQPLPLGCLGPDTAQKVFTEPLDALDIAMEEKTELIRQVMELTSGHPYLIQYIGWELVSAANDYKRTERKILLSDLNALRTSAKFADEYLGTIWGNTGPLEKLITLLAPAAGFKIETIEDLLAKQGIQVTTDELDTALRMLRTYAILDEQEQTYTFVPRAFHDILQRTRSVKRLIAQTKKRLNAGEM